MSLIILTAHSVSQERKLKELENHPPQLMKFYLCHRFLQANSNFQVVSFRV